MKEFFQILGAVICILIVIGAAILGLVTFIAVAQCSDAKRLSPGIETYVGISGTCWISYPGSNTWETLGGNKK